jgi:hypothetical protein
MSDSATDSLAAAFAFVGIAWAVAFIVWCCKKYDND